VPISKAAYSQIWTAFCLSGPFTVENELRRYLIYLEEHININPESAWLDANKHKHLLSRQAEATLGSNFTGTTDAAIVEQHAKRSHSPKLGLRVLFEVKRKVESQAVYQARTMLLLGNFQSPESRPYLVSACIAGCVSRVILCMLWM